MSAARLRLATRRSPLAMRQAELVAAQLEASSRIAVDLVPLETLGDRLAGVPISSLAGRGVFSAEVDLAVLSGRADAAVHSAKDLPASSAEDGLCIAAVPERSAVQDALVGRRLDELAPGALVATGAPRRRAQLAWLRPDLGFVELRGNVHTRLSKVPAAGAVVVALAALCRLGLEAEAAEVLPTTAVLPQVGQGALAVRCREDDGATREALAAIDHPGSHRALLAERALLAGLGGGCDAPIGGLATEIGAGGLRLEGVLASADGHVVVRRALEGDDPTALGRALAAELLEAAGGRALVGDRP
ncbi:MAG TPA: hydroxymethylbilane synthase [Acidimicrobiales bacterium]|nr:hydroxymethylbilane synthase [Acidimicrobiales bacterium]